MAEGVEKRGNSYRAAVWSRRDQKPIRETFPTMAAAKAWRAATKAEVDRDKRLAPTPTTVREAAEEWLAAARQGTIRTRSGDPYKLGAIRTYERALRLRVLPRFGEVKLAEVQQRDLQDFVDELVGQGLGASTSDA